MARYPCSYPGSYMVAHFRCRTNMARVRQSMPDTGFGF